MKKNTLFWITGIVLLAVLLLFVPSMLMYGQNSMHNGDHASMMGDYGSSGPGSSMMEDHNMMGDYGYGMVGGGMTFGWIIPIVILILVIAGGVWLGNFLTNRGINRSTASTRTCSNCNKPADADWKTCPYCSAAL